MKSGFLLFFLLLFIHNETSARIHQLAAQQEFREKRQDDPVYKDIEVDLSSGEAGATSVLKDDDQKFGAANAFKRAHFKSKDDRSFPWASKDLPATVYIKLPTPGAYVSGFSFRSRPEPFGAKGVHGAYGKDWLLAFNPVKFEFVGSHDCVKWFTIFRVESTIWEAADEEKKWQVPLSKRYVFPCIGFKVLESGRRPDEHGGVTIQDAKFYQPGCKKVDMQLILDSSGTMEYGSWNNLIEFVKVLINGIFGNSESRLAIMRYGDDSEVLQELRANVTGSWLKDKKYNYVDMIRPFTGDAMVAALPAFKTATVDSDSKKILLLITDGEPTDGSHPISKAAKEWKDTGAKFYAMGIGMIVNKLGLGEPGWEKISDPADRSYLLRGRDFETIFEEIIPDICGQD